MPAPVEHEAARPGEAAQVARLIAVRHQLELQGLETVKDVVGGAVGQTMMLEQAGMAGDLSRIMQ